MWPAEIRSLCCLTLAKSGSLPARGQVAQQEGARRTEEHDDDHETEIPELEWGDPEEKRGDQEIESPELEGLGEEPENAKWEMVKSRWQKRLEKKSNQLKVLKTIEPEGLCVIGEGEWECLEMAVDS